MRVLISILCITSAWSYSHFRDAIPNGDRVPHPCKANYIWKGVGHLNPLGGGERNPFGVDFKNAGAWTKALCEMDSDGDGVTNGAELGDPNCVWEAGEAPESILGLSHPGVCTPHSDPSCQAANEWIDCEIAELICDAINETGVKNITVRFPETVVPPTETNYYCMMFDLPSDGDYHVVAASPVIDNEDVMHHILIFGCDETDGPINDYPMYSPQSCGMSIHPKCSVLIGTWTVGSIGNCEHENAGFRIGQQGFKKAIYQFHWNNPQLRSDYKDSSGMTLYYTPNRRMHDASILMIGQQYIEIPPGQEEVRTEGWCTADCTIRQLKAPIYITSAGNHMHYLGRQQRIEHFRNGVKLRDVTYEETYNYDSPFTFTFQEPVEVWPGDELKTTCMFKSLGINETTFWGESTSDEMCYGFLTFYPAENMRKAQCLAWKGLPVCKLWDFPQEFPVIDGCNVHHFQNSSHPNTVALRNNILSRCSPAQGCLPECKTYIRDVLSNHTCLHGDIGDYFRQIIEYNQDINAMKFWAAVDSCKTEIQKDSSSCNTTTDINPNIRETGGIGILSSSALVIISSLLYILALTSEYEV